MTIDFDPNEHLLTRPQALDAGMTDNELGRLVRSGVLRRIRAGAYVPAAVWDALDPPKRHRVLSRAVLAKARAEAVISHTSAAIEHGAPAWGLPLDDVHMTRTDRRAGRREAGVCQHQGRLIEGDLVEVNGVRVTSPTKAALDVATVVGLDASLCVVNDLLRRGLTDLDLLAARYESMRFDPFSLRTNLVLRLADERIASVGETRTLLLCWRSSLPKPVPQYAVTDANGFEVAFLDFAWPELGRWIEFDGQEKYVKYLRAGETVVDAVLREKRREDLVRELTGWRCLRITWVDLADQDRLGARIRAFLGLPRVAMDPARKHA